MNGLAIVDAVYTRLKEGGLTLTGGIHKHRKPLNATKEEIVVNCLTATNEQLQRGVVNVNIYAPAIAISTSAGAEAMPNHVRLNALCNTVEALFEQHAANDYLLDVQQPGLLIQDPNTKEYFINIRLDFYSINT